jgi:hypothetical protein
MERNVDDRQCLLELPDISQISQVWLLFFSNNNSNFFGQLTRKWDSNIQILTSKLIQQLWAPRVMYSACLC